MAKRQAIKPGKRRRVLARDGAVCWLCGKGIAVEEDLTLDHVRPVCRGGSNAAENLRPAHRACNEARGSSWDGVEGVARRPSKRALRRAARAAHGWAPRD